ncbi:MAG: hypothetical protein RIT81_44060 [Deltaproteobacteria bacterium]
MTDASAGSSGQGCAGTLRYCVSVVEAPRVEVAVPLISLSDVLYVPRRKEIVGTLPGFQRPKIGLAGAPATAKSLFTFNLPCSPCSAATDQCKFENVELVGTSNLRAIFSDAPVRVASSKIEGFSTPEDGAAIYMRFSDSALELEDVVIQQNSAGAGGTSGRGGAVYLAAGASLAMQAEVLFSGNTASEHGGAIYVEGGSGELSAAAADSEYPPLEHFRREDLVVLEGNAAYAHGGAIYFGGGTLDLSRVTFESNHADARGGALYVADADPGSRIERSWFQDNGVVEVSGPTSSPGEGGAVFVHDGSLRFENDFFLGNGDWMQQAALARGGALYIDTGAAVELAFSAATFSPAATTLHQAPNSTLNVHASLLGIDYGPAFGSVCFRDIPSVLTDDFSVAADASCGFTGSSSINSGITGLDSSENLNPEQGADLVPFSQCVAADFMDQSRNDLQGGPCDAGPVEHP